MVVRKSTDVKIKIVFSLRGATVSDFKRNRSLDQNYALNVFIDRETHSFGDRRGDLSE
jgi:hypothetical protein